jgi:hypothetical protein
VDSEPGREEHANGGLGMAEVTPQLRRAYGFMPDLVPNHVLKNIDQSELLDRLVCAASSLAKAEDSRDKTLATGFKRHATAVLTAPPREAVLAQHRAKIQKAAQFEAQSSYVQAERLRRAAATLLAESPVAPERMSRLTKAEANSGLIPVFDAAGNLVGLAKPAAITPVADMPDLAKDAADAETVDEILDQPVQMLGTPKDPADAEIPATMGMPGEVAKAMQPLPRRVVGIVPRPATSWPTSSWTKR